MAEGTITTSKPRIDTIDVLRGFALAGILYAHMVIWYTGASLPMEVYTKYDSTLDGVAMGIFGALVLGKFFSVFSFLFGLSFHLQLRKRRSSPAYKFVYLWRLFLLFLIGVVHHIFWRGDILAIYAVLGVMLLFFRKFSSSSLLVISLILITNLPVHLYDVFSAKAFDAQVSLPMKEEAETYYELVRNADFLTVLRENWNSWSAKIFYQLESGRLLMTFGYFLLGLYAGRTELFTSIGKNLRKFLRWNNFLEKTILILLFAGLFMYINDYVTIPEIYVIPELRWLAAFLFDIYNACLTIFYITGITLLFRNKSFKPILEPLAPMGRMALTNYLLQTAFGLMIFYEFGLGLFDKTSPAMNVILAAGVLFLQIKFSIWWLKRYKHGPVEWVWKSLTYFWSKSRS